jgi:prefoldin subunit 5
MFIFTWIGIAVVGLGTGVATYEALKSVVEHLAKDEIARRLEALDKKTERYAEVGTTEREHINADINRIDNELEALSERVDRALSIAGSSGADAPATGLAAAGSGDGQRTVQVGAGEAQND